MPSERPVDVEQDGPEADPESVARKILLDQLTGRARSRKELSDKLASRLVPAEVATAVLDRFEEVGLVDDGAFARTWVSQRQQFKGLSRRVLAQELRRKGVDDEVAKDALDGIDPDDEARAARELVVKKMRSMRGLDDRAATRRLVGMLARKGYPSGTLVLDRARGAATGRTRRGRRRQRLTHHDGGMTLATLRLPPGPVDLTSLDSAATPGFTGGKKEGQAELESLGDGLADLQERLYAEATADVGHGRSVLLVLQGMDTSGKGGVLRHTVGLVDPQGVSISSFKAPTEEELEHDFLWRIRKALPTKGRVGVFDRSHYEDVLIGRVRQLAPAAEIESRYDEINAFEAEVVGAGITMVKCMLHISPDMQKERLLARLADPTKHWKFNPKDIDERGKWADYRRAYEIALERTNTEVAPWYVVPSDRKWYRNLAVGRLLHETLSNMAPTWPSADFDVEEQRARLEDEAPVG